MLIFLIIYLLFVVVGIVGFVSCESMDICRDFEPFLLLFNHNKVDGLGLFQLNTINKQQPKKKLYANFTEIFIFFSVCFVLAHCCYCCCFTIQIHPFYVSIPFCTTSCQLLCLHTTKKKLFFLHSPETKLRFFPEIKFQILSHAKKK